MKAVFTRPQSLTETPMHYCPGCTHGVAHRLVAEVLDELGIRGRTIGVASVGCSVFAYNYFNVDFQQAAHGRAPAVATGIKRVLPDRVVFTYQGDGDLAAIGTAEIVHAANRGEQITVIFINNAVYGMTGGQMAPTTLPGMRTTTTPFGRDVRVAGHPLHVAEMLATLKGVAYLARVALCGVAHITRAKRAIRKAFQAQLDGKGFSLVEVLSTCPVTWGLSPIEAVRWLEANMLPAYPLGEFVTSEGKERL
ncbi:MAG: thiamine pyrophosphate-dependent enzyme [Armatimonadota bacterium]|nr:thiamine pyrophosphate-dependent enzyme [Armatimonadota bacterium]MDR7451562.1 thiamine pyrophosphate-dependent enzyme [Armatimonadota bacterium]MDR7467529.1 thiamine pyrophosphate-dependent enzyme [Armatimonadota bacterium]MDR7494403.1 thiamine pyrophosphate-dependent enzyme [Armatimonadota bacterium]MDR7499220.1 thiamine pyrophosphate-dependent enzyme [Armatimonadota bacterium]